MKQERFDDGIEAIEALAVSLRDFALVNRQRVLEVQTYNLPMALLQTA